jgi:circadian clock protein KaiB
MANLKRLCGEHFAGRYHIEWIDLMKNPRLAKDDQIIAIPALLRKLLKPLRRIIGDLSDAERTLVGHERRPRADRAEVWAPARFVALTTRIKQLVELRLPP